jgi:hypothetical protein
MDGLGEAIHNVLKVLIVCFVLTLIMLIYRGYELVTEKINGETLKSNHIIVPTIELKLNDNQIDTIYVYNNK